MLKLYKRFCCGLFYLQSKVNPDVPVIMTFFATLLLFVLLVNGIDSVIFLLFKTPYFFNDPIVRYSIIVLAGIINYFLVFKDKKFLDYYRDKLPSALTLLIVVVIFGGSLALILLTGPRNLPR
jgi:hypothetical protein